MQGEGVYLNFVALRDTNYVDQIVQALGVVAITQNYDGAMHQAPVIRVAS